MTRSTVPQLLLERLALGELSPSERMKVIAALEQEPEGMQRLEAIAASNGEILGAYPAGQMAAEIHRRHDNALRIEQAAKQTPEGRHKLWFGSLAAATVAAVLAVIVVPVVFSTAIDGDKIPKEYIGIKGDPQLLVYRKTDRGQELLSDGKTVDPGDVLQLKYNAKTAAYGTILSVDGNGSVTLHFPPTVKHSTMLEPKGSHALPFSYELDDAPEFERFFFVADKEPVDVLTVLKAARSLEQNQNAALNLDDYQWTIEMTLLKPTADKR